VEIGGGRLIQTRGFDVLTKRRGEFVEIGGEKHKFGVGFFMQWPQTVLRDIAIFLVAGVVFWLVHVPSHLWSQGVPWEKVVAQIKFLGMLGLVRGTMIWVSNGILIMKFMSSLPRLFQVVLAAIPRSTGAAVTIFLYVETATLLGLPTLKCQNLENICYPWECNGLLVATCQVLSLHVWGQIFVMLIFFVIASVFFWIFDVDFRVVFERAVFLLIKKSWTIRMQHHFHATHSGVHHVSQSNIVACNRRVNHWLRLKPENRNTS
jgi:hypothetical protein